MERLGWTEGARGPSEEDLCRLYDSYLLGYVLFFTLAAVRLAGFRLIQAGLELEPKEDGQSCCSRTSALYLHDLS
jgi:hypothetical protein